MRITSPPATTSMPDHSLKIFVRRSATRQLRLNGYEHLFARSMCGEQHLKCYLVKFEFRYNNRSGLGITDGERTANALRGIEGKRLTYRPTH